MIAKLYQHLDGALMYGANKLVRSWNWTTGRTKADLAGALSLVWGATLTYFLHLKGLDHRIVLTQDVNVESIKRVYKFLGMPDIVLGGQPLIKNDPDLGTRIISSGIAFYIIRADPLPPRKDVVRRSIERIKESLSRKPALQPIPLTKYQSLEERL